MLKEETDVLNLGREQSEVSNKLFVLLPHGFAEVSKNLVRYRSEDNLKIILLLHQNNYIGNS